MSNTRRFAVLGLMVLSLVLAACQPSNAPTPTPRPPTAVPTEEVTEVAMASDATEEATEAMVEPTEEMTMEATEVMVEPTEEMTMEATEEMMMATEEATEVMVEPTEEMTMEATEEMMMATEEPTAEMTMEAEMTAEAPDMTEMTIAEIVIALATADEGAEFTILLAAIQAADPSVLEILNTTDIEITVFAPTDEAFEALLEALDITAEELLADTELLNDVLLYHVVTGSVDAEAVVAAAEDEEPLISALGQEIVVTVTDDGVFLNGTIEVVTTDIMAVNGIIHVIDGVLVPAPTAESTPAA